MNQYLGLHLISLRRILWFGLAGLVFCLVVLPAILVRGTPSPVGRADFTITLYCVKQRKILQMKLEDYLIGVVAAEMPAAFHVEALKAQAVAARTMTIRYMRRFGGRGCTHMARADICDQPEDGQAWLSESDLRERWGADYRRLRQRIEQAVAETRGLILLYDHRPIDAVYHSTCGGRTEDAVNVWGRHIPYLVSVECGYDQASPRFRTEVRMERTRFAHCLGLNLSARVLAGADPLAVQILSRTAAGRVTRIKVGDYVFAGPDFRTAVGLRSADFACRTEGRLVVFTVHGNGHGVGLCQYGAQGMAERGADFASILRHYYRGVNFGRLRVP